MKLVQKEAHSEPLRRYLRRHGSDERVTTSLARVEVVRAVARGGGVAIANARRQLARLHQVHLDSALLDSAATIGPGLVLRSLDDIHLACAQLLGGDLRALVTYDQRMSTAATALGLVVSAPS